MTSYLIDGFLFLALLVTTWRVVLMYRQLRVMSSHHEDYQRIFDQTSEAMDGINVSLQELKVRGEEITKTLGERIDVAKETTVDMNAVIQKAQDEMSAMQEYVEWLQAASDKVGVDLAHVSARLPDRASQAPGRGSRAPAHRGRAASASKGSATAQRPQPGAGRGVAAKPGSAKPGAASAGAAAPAGHGSEAKSAGQRPVSEQNADGSATAVSAVDKQNLRVRKVSFGQAAPFRSVNVKD
ncbi:hypothetical protein [Pseudovibrio sp. SPO723]|uniref:hypothetical protein n=1 Tax=Nesiotobacter zosterae TaxID=392721 RepID=UPI0029C18D66|nr:hypothetical protein [Pseudovibrio sp. SPO723]MDX5593654.1 hypothetical protein [Pseudovibrio sp. SPO723]